MNVTTAAFLVGPCSFIWDASSAEGDYWCLPMLGATARAGLLKAIAMRASGMLLALDRFRRPSTRLGIAKIAEDH